MRLKPSGCRLANSMMMLNRMIVMMIMHISTSIASFISIVISSNSSMFITSAHGITIIVMLSGVCRRMPRDYVLCAELEALQIWQIVTSAITLTAPCKIPSHITRVAGSTRWAFASSAAKRPETSLAL